MDWTTLRPGLISALRRAVSDTYPALWPEGTVQWFGSGQHYISDETAAGVYVRQTGLRFYGAREITYTRPAPTGPVPDPDLVSSYQRQGIWSLEIQILSVDEEDGRDAASVAARLESQLYEDESRADLLSLGLSIVSIRQAALTSLSFPGRSAEAAVLAVDLQLCDNGTGRPVGYFEEVTGTYTITSPGETGPSVDFEM